MQSGIAKCFKLPLHIQIYIFFLAAFFDWSEFGLLRERLAIFINLYSIANISLRLRYQLFKIKQKINLNFFFPNFYGKHKSKKCLFIVSFVSNFVTWGKTYFVTWGPSKEFLKRIQIHWSRKFNFIILCGSATRRSHSNSRTILIHICR